MGKYFVEGGTVINTKVKRSLAYVDHMEGYAQGTFNKPYSSLNNVEKSVIYNYLNPKTTDKIGYEPTQGVKNLKSAYAAASLATGEIPVLGYAIQAGGAMGDLYTASRYAMDGQYKNAGIDATQGILGLLPFQQYFKTATGIGKTAKQVATFNRTLKIGQGASDIKTISEDLKYGGSIPKARLGYEEQKDLYSFSDAFYQALQQAQEQPVDQQDEEYYDVPNQPDETDDYEQKYNDLVDQYDEQVSRNDELQRSLSEQNSKPRYKESYFQEDDPNFVMDFITKNVFDNNDSKPSYIPQGSNDFTIPIGGTSALSYKTKDTSVNVSAINDKLNEYLGTLPKNLQDKILITSGNDYSGHVKNSEHYKGNALDLRYNDELYTYIAKDSTAKKYGVTTLPPDHGTAKHIHLQTKMYGGGDDKKPIVVNDKNDPRLRAYNDSLSAYNKSSKIFNKNYDENHYSVNKRLSYDDLLNTYKKEKQVYTTNGTPIPLNKKPVQPYILQQRQKFPPAQLTDIPQQDLSGRVPANLNRSINSDLTYLPDGTPVYGPANSLIGTYGNNTFNKVRDTQRYRVNQTDKSLLENDEELLKYLLIKTKGSPVKIK